MKGITRKSIDEDLQTISKLSAKYRNAVYSYNEGESSISNWDNQPRLIKLAVADLRSSLYTAESAIKMLSEVKDSIIEDNVEIL